MTEHTVATIHVGVSSSVASDMAVDDVEELPPLQLLVYCPEMKCGS